jgi:hypothetical protein
MEEDGRQLRGLGAGTNLDLDLKWMWLALPAMFAIGTLMWAMGVTDRVTQSASTADRNGGGRFAGTYGPPASFPSSPSGETQ